MSHVRDARFEDSQTMQEVLVSAWQTAYTGIADPALVASRKTNNYAEKFRAMIESGEYRMLVGEVDGRVVGLAIGVLLASDAYDCETKGLYVHPEYQGRGIGKALLQAMTAHFRQCGCRRMIVWTFLGAKNNGFYCAMGGAIAEEQERKLGEKE